MEGRKWSVIIVHQSSIHDFFLSAASAPTFRFPHISRLYLLSTHYNISNLKWKLFIKIFSFTMPFCDGTAQSGLLNLLSEILKCASHICKSLCRTYCGWTFCLDYARLIAHLSHSYYNWTYGSCQLICCKITKKRVWNFPQCFHWSHWAMH